MAAYGPAAIHPCACLFSLCCVRSSVRGSGNSSGREVASILPGACTGLRTFGLFFRVEAPVCNGFVLGEREDGLMEDSSTSERAGRAGGVQPEEEKALERPQSLF